MNRIPALKDFLRPLTENGIALAFSGGVDSTFLLSVLKELHTESPYPLYALTMHSAFQKTEELTDVTAIAERTGTALKIFHCDPLIIPAVKSNSQDRCYHCKHFFFSKFFDFIKTQNIAALLDGSNADDKKEYRPGRRALQELGVISPLAELNFTKAEIRRLSAERGLNCAAKPSAPCLATRFEYGVELTAEKLDMVYRGENILRQYIPANIPLRLRVHGNLARIEVPPDYFNNILLNLKEIKEKLHTICFRFITLDLDGFRSGCYDKKV